MSKNIDEITIKDFQDAIELALSGGHNSIAPLGMSGDTILIHGTNKPKKYQQVSIRLYGGDPELLITNNDGEFLFYGQLDIRLGKRVVAKQWFKIFQLVKDQICTSFDMKTNIVINKDAKQTIGFAMIDSHFSN